MATSYNSVHVECCYYKSDNGRKIRCECLIKNGIKTETYFESEKEKKNHMENYCMDVKNCNQCMMKQALDKKYE